MEIIEIQTNTELKKAKDHLIYAARIMILFIIASVSIRIEILASLLFFASLLYNIYAIYKFSKLTNSSLFRYYIVLVIVQFISTLLILLLNFIATNGLFILADYIFILGFSLYIAYKMSYEMSAITDLSHFTKALLCLILAMIATTVTSVFFIMRGLIKMEYVKVCNKSN